MFYFLWTRDIVTSHKQAECDVVTSHEAVGIWNKDPTWACWVWEWWPDRVWLWLRSKQGHGSRWLSTSQSECDWSLALIEWLMGLNALERLIWVRRLSLGVIEYQVPFRLQWVLHQSTSSWVLKGHLSSITLVMNENVLANWCLIGLTATTRMIGCCVVDEFEGACCVLSFFSWMLSAVFDGNYFYCSAVL